MAVNVKATDSITLFHQVDIASVTWYYKLQSSTAAPPAQPTTDTPTGWSTAEPTYTEGSTNSLYVVEKTKFSNGTFEYSPVSLSSSYEAAKIAYNKSVMALEAATPIATKTYSGLIGSANDAANASFYFAKIHPTNYTVNWKVRFKIAVQVPEAYQHVVDIQFGGYGSSFSSYDSFVTRTGSYGLYFINLYRATQAGITNHKGHAVGFGLRSSYNPTAAAYARTIYVELLETENCTVDMLDTAVKYANMDGTGSTNYSALTEMGVVTAGQNATNNSNTHYSQYGTAVKAGTFGVKRYTLLMRDTPDTWVSFVNEANNTGTNKTVSTGGHILGKLLYSGGSAEYASGANTSTVWDGYQFDFRYSANITTSSLTAYKAVYLVGTIGTDGKFYLDPTTWWTQTPPTTEDGKTYILIGDAYNGYCIWLSVENPAYQYYEGKFMKLEDVEAAKAAKSATKYITDLTDGIFVAPEGQGPNDTQTPTGWKIQDALELLKAGVSYIWAGLVNNVATVRVGKEAGGHSVMDESGMRVYGGSDGTTQIANLGYGEGNAQSGTAEAPYYTFGTRATGSAVGNWSVVEGRNNTASGFGSHAEGARTTASGSSSHAEGEDTVAAGTYSHAEGMGTSTASGMGAQCAHAEGRGTQAKGRYSHAEGYETLVKTGADAGHAGGIGTIVEGEAQTAIGKYNVADTSSLFIVGKGTSDSARSNAFKVKDTGDVVCAGRCESNDWTGTRRTPVSSISGDGLRVGYMKGTSATNLVVCAQWGTAGGAFSEKNVTVSSSDIRLKKNVEDCEIDSALDIINQIRLHSFDWLHTDEHQKIGFIADELEQIDPKLSIGGGTEKDGTINYKSVDTFYMMGYLVKAVQELSTEINRLKGAAA